MEFKNSKENVNIDYFNENIYYLNGSNSLLENEQSIIEDLLVLNQGVGVMAGYFDSKFSIQMLSELTIRVLGYDSFDEFYKETDGCLMNMVETEEERNFLRKALLSSKNEFWTFPLKAKGGKFVSFSICNFVYKTNDNKSVWYMSIRRFRGNFIDSLTGGYNRYGFIYMVTKVKKSKNIKDYAILYIDIHGFKAVNDMYGPESGDEVLVSVYKNLVSGKLNPIVCARKDSDHFLLLVKKDKLNYDKLAKELDVYWNHGDRTLFLHAVCGVYLIDDDSLEIPTMIDNAKTAIDYIQDEFVKPYHIYSANLCKRNTDRINVLSGFNRAITNNEFKVYFQPIIDAKTSKIVSAEALVRWDLKEEGIIPPAIFIPILEKSGYIVQLDRYVMSKIKDFILNKINRNEKIIPISVNLSQMDFFANNSGAELYENLKNTPILSEFMHFEITESSYASAKEIQHNFIEKLHSLNAIVYLDDFGMGSASLRMLDEYNFDVLKIDMRYITQMLTNKKTLLLVKMIIKIAHQLNMKVVAEGVETQEQFLILKDADCDYMQGYYFSKPLREEDFIEYMNKNI